jgi:hypothetical protein
VELEPLEPSHGGLAPFGELLENFVAVNTTVVADHDGGGVDEGKPGDCP